MNPFNGVYKGLFVVLQNVWDSFQFADFLCQLRRVWKNNLRFSRFFEIIFEFQTFFSHSLGIWNTVKGILRNVGCLRDFFYKTDTRPHFWVILFEWKLLWKDRRTRISITQPVASEKYPTTSSNETFCVTISEKQNWPNYKNHQSWNKTETQSSGSYGISNAKTTTWNTGIFISLMKN